MAAFHYLIKNVINSIDGFVDLFSLIFLGGGAFYSLCKIPIFGQWLFPDFVYVAVKLKIKIKS